MLRRHNWCIGRNYEYSHIIYHLKVLSLLIIFSLKTMIWQSCRKEIFDIFFSSVVGKNLKQGNNENYFFKHAQIVNHQWVPSGHTTSNPRRFDMDITSIRRRQNFHEFPRHFPYFFDVISMVENSTWFPRTFFDVISLVENADSNAGVFL